MSQSITDKDWLDLAFKHFVQHAQQRVQHFNYFILFSSLLTTATITTFQPIYKAYYIAFVVGFIQIVVAYIFIQLDYRNRALIKHSENIIMQIEQDYKSKYPLFSTEETETAKIKVFKKPPFSHRKSYLYIYRIFIGIGSMSIIASLVLLFTDTEEKQAPKASEIRVKIIEAVDINMIKANPIINTSSEKVKCK